MAYYFSNICRQFIPNYSTIRVPLTPQRIIETEPDKHEAEKRSKPIKKAPLVCSDPDQGLKKPGDCEVYVKKWIDYSEKYGIGYHLSDGTYGVFFNDSSNVILAGKGKVFYIERKDSKSLVLTYSLESHPPDLSKKIKLFLYFQNYLCPPEVETPMDVSNVIYLRFWAKRSKCLMFILSTKIVQFNFSDETELVINKKTKIVTLFDKNREKKIYPLNSALQSSNLEMTKRLRYAIKIYSEVAKNSMQKNKNLI